MTPETWVILAVFGIAMIYSSVGHGGASGYLAALSLIGLSKTQASTLALLLNLAVAGLAFYQFKKAGAFSWRHTWPFLIGSVPFAFAGGMFKLSDKVFYGLVAFCLAVAATRLLWNPSGSKDALKPAPSTPIAAGIGGGIGLLSGLVGVGGGIFLSPILVLSKWLDARTASGCSALFILVNSLAGLGARAKEIPGVMYSAGWLLIAGIGGALLGSYLGANRIPSPALPRLLGAVLFVAAVKLLIK